MIDDWKPLDDNHTVEPSTENDRTALLKEIAHASDTPSRPTKWNLQNSDSPRQTLQKEYNNRFGSLQQVSHQEDDWQPISTSPEKDDWQPITDTPKDDWKPIETPSTLKAIEQGALNTVGQVANLVGGVAGGVINAPSTFGLTDVTTPVGDALIGWGKDTKESLSKAILTPEEQAAENIPQKILAGVPGIAAVLPLGPAAPFAMGAMQGFNAGTEAIDEGAGLTDAARLSGIQGAAGYVTGRLPIFGKNVKEAAAIGALSSPIIGAGTDWASNFVVRDAPEVADKYKWNNLESRIVDIATGGLYGGAFKYIHQGQEKAGLKKILEDLGKDDATSAELFKRVGDSTTYFLHGRNMHQPDNDPLTAGLSYHDAWLKLVDNPEQRRTAAQYLDLMAQDPEMKDPDHARLVAGLSRISRDFGLDRVAIDLGDADGPAGSYHSTDDQILIKRATVAKDELKAEAVLHEITHSLSARLYDMYVNHTSADGGPTEALSKPQVRVWELMDRYKALFDTSHDKFLTEYTKKLSTVLTKDNFWDIREQLREDSATRILNDEETAFVRLAYAFKSPKEMMAMQWTNPLVRDYLKTQHLSENETQALRLYDFSPIPSLFDSLKTNDSSVYKHATDYLATLMTEKKQVPEITHVKNENGDVVEINDFYHNRVEEASAYFNERIANLSAGETEFQRDLFRKIAFLAENTYSGMEFNTRMRALDNSANWQKYVDTFGQRLFQNPLLLHWAKGSSVGRDLGPNESRTHQSDLNIDEAIKTFGITELKKKDDLNVTGKTVLPQEQMSVLKSTTPLGKLTKWVMDKAREYRAMESNLYADIVSHLNKAETLKTKDQDGLYNVILEIGQNHAWVKQAKAEKRLWATDAELQERGLNPKQIEAYRDMTVGVEKAYNLENQIRIRNKQEPLEQIPGYFPHVWKGPYRVLMVATKRDPKTGFESKFTIAVKPFRFRQQAEKFAEELQSGKHDALYAGHFESVRPDIDQQTELPYRIMKHEDLTQGLMPSMAEHMESFQNRLKFSEETISVIQRLERDTMAGMNKHSLEREGSDVAGWLGQGGLKENKSWFGTEPKANREVKDIYRNYVKSVVKHYTNNIFLDEVGLPILGQNTASFNRRKMYGEQFANTPNFLRYMSEYMMNFTGNNPNKLKFLDEFLQKQSIAIGIDPLAYRQFSRGVRNALTAVKLRANPANYIANMFQPINVISLLEMHNSFRAMDGKKGVSGMKAFGKVFSPNYKPDLEAVRAVQWAKDMHYIDPQLQHQLHEERQSPLGKLFSTLTLEHVNSDIELTGRIKSFLVAHEFFREMYPNQPIKAREAAAKIMEMTMVNYNRESRPLLFQNFGVVGDQLSPFAVFRQAYIGNTWNMMKLMWQAPTLSARFKPIFMSQVSFLATAGALGMIGVSEINMLIDGLNTVNPEWEIPRVEEMLFHGHVPDWMTFGALSASTKAIPGLEEGVYLGSAMNAVGLDDLSSVPTVQFMKAVLALAGAGTKSVLATAGIANPPTWNDIYGPARQVLPGIAQPWMDKALLPNPYVAPKSTNLNQGYVERTDEGYNSMFTTGRKSLDETVRSNQERVIATNRQLDNKTTKQLIDLAADKALGLQTNISTEDIYRKLARMGMPVDEIAQKIVEAMQNRALTQRMKEAAKSGVSEEQYRAMRREMER